MQPELAVCEHPAHHRMMSAPGALSTEQRYEQSLVHALPCAPNAALDITICLWLIHLS